MKYIVAWMESGITGSIKSDYRPFESMDEAKSFYTELVDSGAYSVNLTAILESTDY